MPNDFSNDLWFSDMSAESNPARTVYAPHIRTPIQDRQFNQGVVNISWDVPDPPTSLGTSLENVSFEIQYTDKYNGSLTNWYALKNRIPYSVSSYDWNVGKMIKSDSVRIRMRTKNHELEDYSDWSISDEFSINVFKLIAPAIINPESDVLYNDFILVILDETLTKDTFSQKVRYTLDYMSRKRGIDWTTIKSNIPFGHNVIRWDISSLLSSDDYSLRLTAKNFSTSCQEASTPEPDQIRKQYVHDIVIQQSGMFIIDTKPPEALIEIENSSGVTNQLEQTVNIFAEDESSEVVSVQMRECDAGSILALGDLEDPYDPYGGCTPVSEILNDLSQFGKPVGNATKLQWIFDDKSGLKKLEALLSDTGGNTSIQNESKVFLNVFKSSATLTDFEIVVEQRDSVTIDETTSPPSVVVEPSVFEVVYVSTNTGEFWILEPFPKLIYTLTGNPSIQGIIELSGILYLITYSDSDDIGKAYRHDGTEATLLKSFDDSLSILTGDAEYDSYLYLGFENGKLWRFNGVSFSLINTFTDPISTLFADRNYLYIGFQNSNVLQLYNGTTFTEVSLS